MKTLPGHCRRTDSLIGIAALLLLLSAGVAPASADEAMEAKQLVGTAKMVMSNFHVGPEMEALRDLMKKAKGVFIAPQVLKGAFIFGISGGSGVLLTKGADDGIWHGPAFYTIGEVSYGLQAGGEDSEVILLAMTERGVTAFLNNSLKLGADASVAAGPVGAGAAAATANLSADIISFSRSKGVFGGVALTGAVVATRDNLNDAYYSKRVNATDILIRHVVSNPQADALIAAIVEVAEKH